MVRLAVFILAATSIANLLAEMYGWLDMRTFFYAILLPANVLLLVMAVLGPGLMRRMIVIGTIAGLVAAVAYDVFRLPFVFADALGLSGLGVPQMPLFKVFPRFGARLLGEPLEQGAYSLAAHMLGWAYHFSNGAMFGVMFAAMRAAPLRGTGQMWRTVAGSVAMAVGIEVCLLASPYAKYFNITPTPTFVAVTLAAHVVFGLALGPVYHRLAVSWRESTARG